MATNNPTLFPILVRVMLLLIYCAFQHHLLRLDCDAYLIRDVCQDQLLKQEAEEPPELAGLWISTQCEARPENEYIVRHYQFYLNATFELHQFYYNTPNCDRNPIHSVTAYGRFRGMQRSWILLGGVEAEYALYKVVVTPHNREALRHIRPLYEQQCLHAKLDHDYWTVNTPFVILRDDSVMLNPLMAGRTLTQGVTSDVSASLPTVSADGMSNMFGTLDSSSHHSTSSLSRGAASAIPVPNENSTNNAPFLTAGAEDNAELNLRSSTGEARPTSTNNNNYVLPIPTSIRLRTSAISAAAASAADTPLDCLELFNITFNELQLFRVEKSFWLQQAAAHSSEVHHEAWQVHHRQRMSRLLWLGNIYPHYQWRSEFKPASYQIFPLHFADGLVLTTTAPPSSSKATGTSSLLAQPSPTVTTPVTENLNGQSALINSLLNFVENNNQQQRATATSQRQRSAAHANNINFQRIPPVLPQAQPQSINQKWLPLSTSSSTGTPNSSVAAQNKGKEAIIYQAIAGAWHSTHNCEVEEDGAFIRREVLFGPRGEWSMMNTHFRDAACQQKLRTDLGIGRWTLDNGNDDSPNHNDSMPFVPRDTEASRRRHLIESLEKINNEFSDTSRLPSERLYRQTGGHGGNNDGGAKSVQVEPQLQLDDLAAEVQVNVDQMFITLHDTSLVSVMKDTGCGHNDWAVDVRVNVTALPQCHRLGIRVPSTRHTSLLLYRDIYGNLLLFVALHVGRTSSSSRDTSSSGSGGSAAGVPAPMRTSASSTRRSTSSASSLNSAYYAKESGQSSSSQHSTNSHQSHSNNNNDVLVLRHPLVNCKKRGLEFNSLQTSPPSSSSSTPTVASSSSSSRSTTVQQPRSGNLPVTSAPSPPVAAGNAPFTNNNYDHVLRPYELPRNFNTTPASTTKISSFSGSHENNYNRKLTTNEFDRLNSPWTQSAGNNNNRQPPPTAVPSRTPHVFVPVEVHFQPPAPPTHSFSSPADSPTATWRSNHIRPQPTGTVPSGPVTLITYDVVGNNNDAGSVSLSESVTSAAADAESATQQYDRIQQQQQADMMVDETMGKSGGSSTIPCVTSCVTFISLVACQYWLGFVNVGA